MEASLPGSRDPTRTAEQMRAGAPVETQGKVSGGVSPWNLPCDRLSMDAIALLDRKGRYVLAIVDGEPIDIEESVWERIHDDDRDRVSAILMRCIVRSEAARYRAKTADGQTWDVWLHPVKARGVAVCAICWRVDERILRLPDRQREVCRLLGAGFAPKEIAAKLDLSLSTVDTHRYRARVSLGMTARGFRVWCCDNRHRL